MVGSVQEIGLDPEDPQRVRLVLAIERGVPIKQDTVAVLTLQGLTGIAFLDLEGGSKESPLLAPTQDGGHPGDRDASLVVPKARHAGDRTRRRAHPDGAERQRDSSTTTRAPRFSARSATSTASSTRSPGARRRSTPRCSTRRARRRTARARASSWRSSPGRSRAAAEAVTRAGERTTGAAEAVRATAADATGGVEELRADTLPELKRLLADARVATAALGRLAQELERSPNALLVGREPIAPRTGRVR